MRPPWLAASMRLEQRASQVIAWPSKKYLHDPAAFWRQILGVNPWAMQSDIMSALLRENAEGFPNAKVCVRSCNGVGKTFVAAGAALWWHSMFPDAQIICSAPVLRQVNDQIWRSIRQLHAQSGVCVRCRADGFPGRQCEHSTRLDGDPARTPEGGLIVDGKDGLSRILKGFVAVSAKTAVGYFGVHQLWIGDEAAGLRDDWIEAAQAACKGGGSILAIGNPTELTGFHAAAFLQKSKAGEASYWSDTFTISALDSPNVRAGKTVIRGLVTAEWVESCRLLWGENSDLYRIRVLGVHPEHSKGMLVSHGEIDLMHARWSPIPKGTALPPCDDGLWIGVDVAAFDRTVEGYTVTGSSGLAGDKWVMVAVRGSYVCEVQKFATMTRDELVVRLVDIARKWRSFPGERVTVRYDAEGNNGAECQAVLEREQAGGRSELPTWQIDGVKVSIRMDPKSSYGTIRDAAYANLAEWIREGGAVEPDAELDDDLVHTTWRKDPYGGKERIAEKVDIKKKLPHGRSPDTVEGLMLAVWTGRVIGHTDREIEGDADYVPQWLQGADKVQRSKYDPGLRMLRRAR